MAKLPIDTRLKIEKEIEDGELVQGFRPYLGMSGIAASCSRKLWYGFRCVKASSISPRIGRLFQRGHKEEPIIQADLKAIGVICHVDPNDQPEVTHGSGHIKGHPDDILENIPDAPKTKHLGEYKTHNDKSFKDMVKKGLKASKPVHYGQMITYMYKLKLKRGLYIAVNKNDDARYYERISSDNEKAKEYLERAVGIIGTEVPPPKAFKSTWFECKWCDCYQICHFGESVLKHCRTCQFGDICDDGIWECSSHKRVIPWKRQTIGCKRYRMMEGL